MPQSQSREPVRQSVDHRATESLVPSELLNLLPPTNQEVANRLSLDYLPLIISLAHEQAQRTGDRQRLVADGTAGFYEAIANLPAHLHDYLMAAIKEAMALSQSSKDMIKPLSLNEASDHFWSNGRRYDHRQPADFLDFMKHNFTAIRGIGEYYDDVVQLLFGLRQGVACDVETVAQRYGVQPSIVYKRLSGALAGIREAMLRFKFPMRQLTLQELVASRPDLLPYLNVFEQAVINLQQPTAEGAVMPDIKLIDLQRQCGLAHQFPADMVSLKRRLHRKLLILDNFTHLLQTAGHQPTAA